MPLPNVMFPFLPSEQTDSSRFLQGQQLGQRTIQFPHEIEAIRQANIMNRLKNQYYGQDIESQIRERGAHAGLYEQEAQNPERFNQGIVSALSFLQKNPEILGGNGGQQLSPGQRAQSAQQARHAKMGIMPVENEGNDIGGPDMQAGDTGGFGNINMPPLMGSNGRASGTDFSNQMASLPEKIGGVDNPFAKPRGSVQGGIEGVNQPSINQQAVRKLVFGEALSPYEQAELEQGKVVSEREEGRRAKLSEESAIQTEADRNVVNDIDSLIHLYDLAKHKGSGSKFLGLGQLEGEISPTSTGKNIFGALPASIPGRIGRALESSSVNEFGQEVKPFAIEQQLDAALNELPVKLAASSLSKNAVGQGAIELFKETKPTRASEETAYKGKLLQLKAHALRSSERNNFMAEMADMGVPTERANTWWTKYNSAFPAIDSKGYPIDANLDPTFENPKWRNFFNGESGAKSSHPHEGLSVREGNKVATMVNGEWGYDK